MVVGGRQAQEGADIYIYILTSDLHFCMAENTTMS